MLRLKSSFSLAALCTILCCLAFSPFASAQAPQGINYQAVARDTSGQPIGNSALTVEITISDTVLLNLNEYVESHNVQTNRFGLFTLVIGEGALVSGSTVQSFEEIDWSSGRKWIGVTVGGVDMGVSELVSVPFALYAERAGNVVVIDSTDLVGSDFVIYQSNGVNDTTDFSSFAPLSGDTIDTVAIVGDSLLRIVERGDTFDLNISSFFNNDTNELIDSILLGTEPAKTLAIIEGNDTHTVSLAGLSDSVAFFQIDDDELKLVVSSNLNDTSSIALAAYRDSIVFDTIENGQIKLVMSSNLNDTTFIDAADLVNNDTNERITNMLMLPGPNKTLVISEGNAISDSVSLQVLSDSIIFDTLIDGTLKLVLSSQPLDTSEIDLSSLIGIDTNITSGALVGSELRLYDNQNDSVVVNLGSLATDSELATEIATINNQMDVDSLLFDGRVDSAATAIAVNLAQINTNQDSIQTVFDSLNVHIALDNDTDSDNETIDTTFIQNDSLFIVENGVAFAVDLAVISGADSLIDFALIGDTLLRITDGDGSVYNVNIGGLTTDAELAAEVATINNQMDVDSLLFDGRVDSAATAIAANLAQIGINQDSIQSVFDSLNVHIALDNDISASNETIDTAFIQNDSLFIVENGETFSVDLALISNADSLVDFALIGDTLLRITDGDGSVYDVNVTELTTDSELAAEIVTINNQMDVDSLLFDGRIDSAATAIAANLTQIGINQDSIQSVFDSLNVHIALDSDTDSDNETIDTAFIQNDSLFIVENGETFSVDLALISNADSLVDFALIGDTLLRITDGDGSVYDVNVTALTTDSELAAEVATINNQMDVDSLLFDGRIDSAATAIAANLAQIGINQDSIQSVFDSLNVHIALDNDTDSDNETIDTAFIQNDSLFIVENGATFSVDLALISNSDSLVDFALIGDTLLRITDGDGSVYDVNVTELTTDSELATEIATINNQMDVDSLLFDGRIDSAATAIAANLVQIGINQDSIQSVFDSLNVHIALDNDTDSDNETIDTAFIQNDSLFIVENGETFSVDLALISNSDSLVDFALIGDTLLRITDGDGSVYDVNVTELTTDSELAAEIVTINNQMDVDSLLFDGRIDSAATAIAANLAQINTNQDSIQTVFDSLNVHIALDNDTDSDNETIDTAFIQNDSLFIVENGETFSVDLALISNSDSLVDFALIGDTLLRITDGDGSVYDVNVTALTTDSELAAEIATINNQMDVDSLLFDGRIDSAATAIAANLAQINTNQDSIQTVFDSLNVHIALDNDTSASNETIDTAFIQNDSLFIVENGETFSVDLALISNSDSLVDFALIGDTLLRITDGDGSVYDVNVTALTTDSELAAEIVTINNQMDVDSLLFDGRIDSAATAIAANLTQIGINQDSIQSVFDSLNVHIALDNDTDSDNETIDTAFIQNDSLFIVENGETFSVDLALISNSDSLVDFALIGDTLLRITDGDGSVYDVNVTELTTDSELAAEIITINNQMDVDSLLFDGRIDSAATAIAANLTQIGINQDSIQSVFDSLNVHIALDNDTDSDNETIDTAFIQNDSLFIVENGTAFSVDLALISNADSLVDFALIGDTLLRITDGDGSVYDVNVTALTTDSELAAEIVTINNQMDVDSLLFDGRIDSAATAIAANLAQINVNQDSIQTLFDSLNVHIALDNDTSASNETIDTAFIQNDSLFIVENGTAFSVDLALISNADSLVDFALMGDTLLRITDGDGSVYDVNIGGLTTDAELATEIATINNQMDVDSLLFDGRIDSAATAIAANLTQIGINQDSIQSVFDSLNVHIALDNDTSASNETIDTAFIQNDSLFIVENGETFSVDLALISNSDSLVDFALIGDTLLRITDGDGSVYDVNVTALTTDSELATEIATINNQMDVDSLLFDGRIDSAATAIAANLTQIGINQDSIQTVFDSLNVHIALDNDTSASNETIDTAFIQNDSLFIVENGTAFSVDLAVISNADSLVDFVLIGDTLLRITDGDGSVYNVNIGGLTTDAELAAEVATINNQMDVDSLLFDGRIDSAATAIAANLAQIGINQDSIQSVFDSLNVHIALDNDMDSDNETIDTAFIQNDSLFIVENGTAFSVDLALISNADSLVDFALIGDTLLRITDGDGSVYDVNVTALTTDSELAAEIVTINNQMDVDSLLFDGRIDSAATAIAANLAQINVNQDSIQSVFDSLNVHIALDNDTDSDNETIDTAFIQNDSLFIVENGATFSVDLALISNSDSLVDFALIGDTLLRITDGDGSVYDVNIGGLTTDAELAAEIATINNQMDVDSLLFDGRIDSAATAIAANLAQIGINQDSIQSVFDSLNVHIALDNDTDSDNETIDTAFIQNDSLFIVENGVAFGVDLGLVSNQNADSLIDFKLIGDTLRITDGDSSVYDVDISSLATVTALNDSVSNLNQVIDDDFTYLLDSIIMVSLKLDSLDSANFDADSTNELQSLSFNSGTSQLTLSNPIFNPLPTDLSSLANDDFNELIDSTRLVGSDLLIYQGGNSVADTTDLSSLTGNAVVDSVFLNPQGDSVFVVTNFGVNEYAIADADSTNELQSISLNSITSQIELSNGGGSVTIDTSNSNEIVTDFSLSGTTLSLDEGFSPLSVDLSSFEDLDSIRVVGDSLIVYTLSGNDTLDITGNDLDQSAQNELVDSAVVSGTDLLIYQGGLALPVTADLSSFTSAGGVDSVYASQDSVYVVTQAGTTGYKIADDDSWQNNGAGTVETDSNASVGSNTIDETSEQGFAVGDGNEIKANAENNIASGNGNEISGFTQNSAVFGSNNTVSGNQSFSAGSSNSVSGNSSTALGEQSTVAGSQSVGIGFRTIASNNRTHAYGSWVYSTATDAVTIGSGVNGSNPMINNLDSTIMLGTHSNLPTLTLRPASGVGTVGMVGIGTSTPTHLLSVDGDMDAGTAFIDSLVINGLYSLPSSAPAANQVLQYNGAVLDWTTLDLTVARSLDTVLSYGSNANNDSIYNLGYLAIGTSTPTSRLEIQDNIENFTINVTNSTSSASDKKGVFSSVTGSGAGDAYGLYGEANSASADKYGVFGSAAGSGGTKYGIYGTASGSGTNYAGYFESGNVYVDDNLGIGVISPTRRLEVGGLAYIMSLYADTLSVDSLTIGGIKFPDANGATSGSVLSYNGTEMLWSPASLDTNTLAEVLSKSGDAGQNNITNLQNLNSDTVISGLALIDTLVSALSSIDILQTDTLSAAVATIDSLQLSQLTIPLNAGQGKVLTSDTFGVATWENAQGDNLGNHTATTTLELAGNNINSTGSIAFSINSSNVLSLASSSGATIATGQFRGVSNNASTAPSYSFSASTTTGMFNPTSNTLGLTTNGVERLRITSSGNIGIGTTSPNNKLEVVDTTGNTTVKIQNSTSGTSITEGLQLSLDGTGNGANTGINAVISGSNTTNTGIRLDVQGTGGTTDINYGIYATASGADTNYAGYFDEGDVFIKDTLLLNSTLKIASGTQDGYYLRTDEYGVVYADTFSASTCPSGFTAVNNDFCIQSDPNTADTWFNAVIDCNNNYGGELPSLSEWYTGVSVGAISARNTSIWEWVDGSTSNNTQRAGGGGTNETISMDSPTNSNTYRCIYKLKTN